MTDIEAVIEKLWGATFMGATATPEQAALCKARYAKILAGWLSPADATAMAQAAMAEAFEKAAKAADDAEQRDRLSLAEVVDDIEDAAAFERGAFKSRNIAKAIRAITPSSGPWQRVPEGTFKIGDRVTKVSGSNWTGLIVGTYSTELTQEGYAVESETERGSVQIYPAKALRAMLAEVKK